MGHICQFCTSHILMRRICFRPPCAFNMPVYFLQRCELPMKETLPVCVLSCFAVCMLCNVKSCAEYTVDDK